MRLLCHCQMGYRVELLPFKSQKHFLTQRHVDYIEYTLYTKMFTVADVLLRMWQSAEVPNPINIAVDEKSYKKGHKYVTIVSDIDRKKVIWVSDGNRKESLDEFFKILGPVRENRNGFEGLAQAVYRKLRGIPPAGHGSGRHISRRKKAK